MKLNRKLIGSLVMGGLGLQLLAGPALLAGTLLPSGDITQSAGNWTTDHHTNSTIETPTVVTDTDKGAVLQVEYNLAGGDYVIFESANLGSNLNLNSRAIEFDLRGDGVEQAFKLEIRDSSGMTYQSVTCSTLTGGVWGKRRFEHSDFHYAFGGNTANGFSWSAIDKFGFTVTSLAAGLGSMTVDNLKGIYTFDFVTSAADEEQLVDDCEKYNQNYLGGATTGLGSSYVNTVTAVAPIQGSTCLQVTSPSTSSGGMFQSLNTGTPLNVTPYVYMSLYIWPEQTLSGNLEVILTDINGSATEGKYEFAPSDLTPGQWNRKLILLSDVTATATSLDLTQLNQLTVAQPANTTIYLDQISFNNFTTCPLEGLPDLVIDTMDTYYANSAWDQFAQSEGQTISLASVDGVENQALKMQYVFTGTDQWKYLGRGFAINLLEDGANALRFDYKGTQANNTIEFKIYDNDTTVFYIKLEDVTNTLDKWKTVTVPYENFVHFGGEDKNFNFKQFTKVGFAITKGDGGEGTFWLHDIRYVKKADFEQEMPVGRVIQSLSIDNNPFAPGVDSSRASATFAFVLNEDAEVGLRVYDLSGFVVREWEKANYAAGTHALVWDGLSRDRQLVRNGLYLYMFTAKGQKHTEKVKNIIAVIR